MASKQTANQEIVAPETQEVQVMSPNVVVISDAVNDKAKWYIVHVYSGHENKVSEALRQRTQTLGLESQILQTLIPTQEKIQIKRGQRKTVNEKIFPGYMLINMEMSDASWIAVKTTQGVTGFVGTGGNKPLPLSKSEVEAIQKYISQTETKFKADYIEGEAVKIIDGPFNDFLGTVSKIDDDKGKVEVLINIFGRETPVELDFLQIEKVK
ncbi:MAG: transcription termination/antitermination protein NusG [bacterium]|nr:transcription termination/antitermination protein NusG [bacterium]